MKIAIISDFNIAGQPTALWRAINKYTKHEARCIIFHDDGFKYDSDIILSKNPDQMEEATKFCKQADFFHFGRGIYNWDGIDFNELLTPYNCCIKYYGSELRHNAEQLRKWHERTKVVGITGTDWSITGLLPGGFYHLNSYFTKYGDMEWDDVPLADMYRGGKLKICAGSAGSPLKGYDQLQKAVDQLRDEGRDIELIFFSGLTNDEVLERKREAHVTFTSLHGAWGISGVESMFIGHAVMSCLDPWILTFFPENPTVIIRPETLIDKIRFLYDNPEKTAELQMLSRIFAFSEFSTRRILKRYLYFIDMVMHREEMLNGFVNPTEIYEF